MAFMLVKFYNGQKYMKFVHIEEVSVLFPSELNCLESVVSQGSKYV